MSSRIKTLHLNLVEKLGTILGSDNKPYFKYINIWDLQIDELIKGKSYGFLTPCVFIEFIPNDSMTLSRGYTAYPNAEIGLHIGIMKFHDGDYFERNLEVFDGRDLVKMHLPTWDLPYCSTAMCSEENPDYDHNNFYKYSIYFRTHFMDNKGSDLDPDTGVVNHTLTNPQLVINENIYPDKIYGSDYGLYVDSINDELYEHQS